MEKQEKEDQDKQGESGHPATQQAVEKEAKKGMQMYSAYMHILLEAYLNLLLLLSSLLCVCVHMSAGVYGDSRV